MDKGSIKGIKNGEFRIQQERTRKLQSNGLSVFGDNWVHEPLSIFMVTSFFLRLEYFLTRTTWGGQFGRRLWSELKPKLRVFNFVLELMENFKKLLNTRAMQAKQCFRAID